MSQPIPFRTTRFRCPHCPRTGASKARITEHIGRCWTNPEARGCKTCRFFVPPEETAGEEYCEIGVNLAGQKQCGTCFGIPSPFEFDGTCPDSANHDGDGREIRPGPIVHCNRWEVSKP